MKGFWAMVMSIFKLAGEIVGFFRAREENKGNKILIRKQDVKDREEARKAGRDAVKDLDTKAMADAVATTTEGETGAHLKGVKEQQDAAKAAIKDGDVKKLKDILDATR